MSPRPLLFLDFDDVIVLNERFGGHDVAAPNPPAELWASLFHAPSVRTLDVVLERWEPRVVITTSWLRFMLRDGFEALFAKTGLHRVRTAMHSQWEAPQNHGETRCAAIERWLAAHHDGEPYVILDDAESGTGLMNSAHQRSGRVILCEGGAGLSQAHLPAIERALTTAGSQGTRRRQGRHT